VASPAAAEVLTALLGELPFTDDSHAPRGMPARSFTSFWHAAREAAQSRLYGGIHYPMSIENGFAQGEQLGAVVLSRLRTRRGGR
jgi:membrane-associated phospholipid phosphatase